MREAQLFAWEVARFALALATAAAILNTAHAMQQPNPAIPVTSVPTSTVSQLPTCTSSNNGIIRRVTDALLPVILNVVVGGGGVTLLVECNGSNWMVA